MRIKIKKQTYKQQNIFKQNIYIYKFLVMEPLIEINTFLKKA